MMFFQSIIHLGFSTIFPELVLEKLRKTKGTRSETRMSTHYLKKRTILYEDRISNSAVP